jgi:choline dehydrogenase-like flavoprotein
LASRWNLASAIRVHNFRHSLATFLIDKRKDVKTSQGLLRHAKASTTLDLYTALGHVLGAGSSINAMVWTRGMQRDYDRWAKNGAKGWAFADVSLCWPWAAPSDCNEPSQQVLSARCATIPTGGGFKVLQNFLPTVQAIPRGFRETDRVLGFACAHGELTRGPLAAQL